ncbi:DNA-binding LytR/AlgR family response regulator [Flavobacterium nitrogenifigens]|uniref:DNA-binding LytR/AlgR family response regulator n=2 Tax=Flavobacterium TaxID=237 RepID=A0A7W7IY50_9FLAO|nr:MULTISPECIES: LytTR family DNA-binding domain-containing protein [Flavobacterium]MBB4802769.1 DNA-binding LytR/AlgR family response regulator [Flavobacterium nitrogenifigens]MBB6387727.1 DNA-binding LytR/AlgR family response regulator [Flavobacterium notoginsengisoli]
MEKLKCLIVDDEPIARDIIESFIAEVPFLELKASFGESSKALVYLEENEIDIVFSDIEMPKFTGLEMAQSLTNPPVIIFITAHRDFALEGFETGASDYLLKPVRFDRFLRAVNRAKEYLSLKKTNSVHQINSDRIFIKSEGKLIKILLNEILYVEAQGDYLKFVINGATYTTLGTLKSMEEVLKLPMFFRVQRSFILNLEAVRSLNGNIVELIDGKTISAALNKKEELYQLLGIR